MRRERLERIPRTSSAVSDTSAEHGTTGKFHDDDAATYWSPSSIFQFEALQAFAAPGLLKTSRISRLLC